MKRVAVFGAAGIMGGNILVELIKNGLSAVAVDHNFADEKKRETKNKLWQKIFWTYKSKAEAEKVFSRVDWINFDVSSGALKALILNSDAIVEAMTENEGAKHILYKEIEAVSKPDTPIFTNTSMIEITSLAKKLNNPERFMGLRFFHPVSETPFIEAVFHGWTNMLTQSIAMELAAKLKKELRFVLNLSEDPNIKAEEEFCQNETAEIIYLPNGLVKIVFGDGRLNLLSVSVVKNLTETLRELKNIIDEKKQPVTAVFLEGRGENFSAGADIKELSLYLKSEANSKESLSALADLMAAAEHMPRFLFAYIRGLALGGGYELALSCDNIIAEEGSVVGLPEVGLGILPGAGGTQRLPRKVGTKKALWMILETQKVKAERPWVDLVLKKGDKINFGKLDLAKSPPSRASYSLLNFLVYAFYFSKIKLAQKIGTVPASSMLALKAIWNGNKKILIGGLYEELEAVISAFKTEDAEEGIRAFVEKRKPHFQGK